MEAFLGALSHRLSKNVFLFLLVSGFEHCPQKGQGVLARIFRTLNERYPDNCRILICGGEKLSDLYVGGTLSLLTNASVRMLPELTVSDVLQMSQEQSKAIALSLETVQALLDFTGGHPLLLKLALGCCREDGNFDRQTCQDTLENSVQVWQLFTSLLQQDAFQRQLPALLNKWELGPARPVIVNPLVKRLYWNSLVKRHHESRKFVWRCELLRTIGQQVVQETL